VKVNRDTDLKFKNKGYTDLKFKTVQRKILVELLWILRNTSRTFAIAVGMAKDLRGLPKHYPSSNPRPNSGINQNHIGPGPTYKPSFGCSSMIVATKRRSIRSFHNIASSVLVLAALTPYTWSIDTKLLSLSGNASGDSTLRGTVNTPTCNPNRGS